MYVRLSLSLSASLKIHHNASVSGYYPYHTMYMCVSYVQVFSTLQGKSNSALSSGYGCGFTVEALSTRLTDRLTMIPE